MDGMRAACRRNALDVGAADALSAVHGSRSPATKEGRVMDDALDFALAALPDDAPGDLRAAVIVAQSELPGGTASDLLQHALDDVGDAYRVAAEAAVDHALGVLHRSGH
jgi:hypothetical protein